MIYKHLILIMFVCFCLNAFGQKKQVLVENLSGTWCGFCPDAMVILEEAEKNDRVISVSVHINDIMEISDGAVLGSEFTGGGVPAFLIDRKIHDNTTFVTYGLERDNIMESLVKQLEEKPICSVDFTSFDYNPSNNLVSVELTAQFFQNYSEGNLRFNLFIIQKELLVNNRDYYQANFYNFQPDHMFQNAGNPIKDYCHKNVLNKMLGGTWGSQGSIKSTNINAGEKLSFVYSFPLDTKLDINNLSLIGLVQEYDGTVDEIEVYNSTKIDFAKAVNEGLISTGIESIDDINFNHNNIYPNPFQDFITVSLNAKSELDVEFVLYDIAGKQVNLFSKKLNKGENVVSFENLEDLPNGAYILRLTEPNGNSIGHKVFKH